MSEGSLNKTKRKTEVMIELNYTTSPEVLINLQFLKLFKTGSKKLQIGKKANK